MDEIDLNDTSVFLPKANSNKPLTDKQKQKVIAKGTKAFEKFLDALGYNWRQDTNSANTPKRFTKAFVLDIARGCYDAPPAITAFDNDSGYDGMVFQGGIPVKSLCSHHLAPFSGRAYVAYLPAADGKIVGLSKLNRIVDFYARRPQVQEGLTQQIVEAVNKICEGNRGVAVVIAATHTCVCNRGIGHDGCLMQTAKLTGEFLDDKATRDEFYQFVTNTITIKGS